MDDFDLGLLVRGSQAKKGWMDGWIDARMDGIDDDDQRLSHRDGTFCAG